MIHDQAIHRAKATATTLGRKLIVGSLSCVTAWNRLIVKPTTKAATSMGAATFAAIMKVIANKSITLAASIDSTFLLADGTPVFHRYPLAAKDATRDLTTKYHPSARTNKRSFKGKLIITGGNMIMPMDRRTEPTTRSITRNGRNNRKPI